MSHFVIVNRYAGELRRAPVADLVAHFGLGGQVRRVLWDLQCETIEDVCALTWREIASCSTEMAHRRIMLLQEYAKAAGWLER